MDKPFSSDCTEHSVAEDECWHSEESQVAESEEHVQVGPVAVIQAKHSCKHNIGNISSKCP